MSLYQSLVHTKGPWEFRAPGRIFIGSVRNFSSVCELTEYETKDEKLLANGRLIAAAPELLEAAIMVLDWFNQYNGVKPMSEAELKLRISIQKAVYGMPAKNDESK